MANSFEFYLHIDAKKVVCRVDENDENEVEYKIQFDSVAVTTLRYDHHGKWFQVGDSNLSPETVIAIGDGIDSYLMSH